MAEVQGTVKRMSPSGKGFVLNEYENWWNFGHKYKGPRPFVENAAITVSYEEQIRADGESNFWVLEAWPTTGQPGPVPPVVTPPGPTPVAAPKVSSGPTPRLPAAVGGAVAGPTPVPPNRDHFILFETSLARAQDWVLATEPEGSVQRSPAHVLYVADLYYIEALKVIEAKGEYEMQQAPPQSYQEFQDAGAGPPLEESA